MGYKRFLKKALIPGYSHVNTFKKMKEHGVVDGMKKTIKEDYGEDMPITSNIYNSIKNEGKYEGKKEGYVKASNEYETKLLKQAEEFLKQKKAYESEKKEREQLINDYEKYIDEMSARDNLSPEENEYFNNILIMERKLKKSK